MTLTPEEQVELRVAIAEEMGWKRRAHGSYSKDGDILSVHDLPPYTTSIDAIREAAMERFKDDFDALTFQHLLDVTYDTGKYIGEWQLTALDWCIAFARTAKIWRWKV